MRLKAVLGIKSNGNKKVKIYRIQDLDNNQIQDIPVDKIIYAMKNKGVPIEGLKVNNNTLVETTDIIKIMELKSNSISLFEWCQQNKEGGQRILEEFNTGGNFPITAKDISYSSHMKPRFRCAKCNKISEQAVNSKTGINCKCKYCAGFTDISLQEWCLNETTGYGKRLLQEYIQGNNILSPDKILYASSKKAYFCCSNCGKINLEKISDRTSYKRKECIKCGTTSTSLGEQLILKWLQSQGLEVTHQKPIKNEIGHKNFDIYLPQLNLVIEKQSGRHVTIEQQFRDETGELIARYQGINYLEVCEVSSEYYREENNWCITYKQCHEAEMIQKLSKWLLKNYNIETNPNYPRVLEDEAYLASCTVKKEESLLVRNPTLAKEWYQPLNGKVTPDKVALNAGRKYYWQCPICGHIYLATPASRNCSGTACPNWRQHMKILYNQ